MSDSSLNDLTTVKPGKKPRKEVNVEHQRRKACERKRAQRLRDPEKNRLNDLRSRVRKICLKKFGKHSEVWVEKECKLRMQKKQNKQKLLGNVTHMNGSPMSSSSLQDVRMSLGSSVTPNEISSKPFTDDDFEVAQALLFLSRC